MRAVEYNFEVEEGYLLVKPRGVQKKGKYTSVDLSITLAFNEENPNPVIISFNSNQLEDTVAAGLTIKQAEDIIKALANLIEFAKERDQEI
jgi:hypothetical protein